MASKTNQPVPLKTAVVLVIHGDMRKVPIPEGMKPVPGFGLDGVTPVQPLYMGTSPGYIDQVFIGDTHFNPILADADKLFVAAQEAARLKGFHLMATRMRN
ncbi:MAG: hypothetical protein JWN18_90 [Parcubacteria group bacterium]|nr:hypothetical protein [Parcubacteria group bacterium]